MRCETTLTLVYLKEKRMRQTDIEAYANGVAQMSDWRRTVTIRPSYKLKAHTSDRIIERMSKSLRAQIFYTMEQDSSLVTKLVSSRSNHNIWVGRTRRGN